MKALITLAAAVAAIAFSAPAALASTGLQTDLAQSQASLQSLVGTPFDRGASSSNGLTSSSLQTDLAQSQASLQGLVGSPVYASPHYSPYAYIPAADAVVAGPDDSPATNAYALVANAFANARQAQEGVFDWADAGIGAGAAAGAAVLLGCLFALVRRNRRELAV
jgi:hypothetical protein